MLIEKRNLKEVENSLTDIVIFEKEKFDIEENEIQNEPHWKNNSFSKIEFVIFKQEL